MRLAEPIKLENYESKNDPINPSHYQKGKVECISAIEAQLTSEEFRGYLKGQIVKYVWREDQKGGTEDLKKAHWYLTHLLNYDEG